MLLAQTTTSASFHVNPLGVAWSVLGLIFSIWVLVDILRRPESQWQAAGQNRGLWIGLGVVGLLCCGLIIGLVYLLAIRPKLESAPTYGMGGGYPPQAGGYPQPGGYPPPPGSYGAPAAPDPYGAPPAQPWAPPAAPASPPPSAPGWGPPADPPPAAPGWGPPAEPPAPENPGWGAPPSDPPPAT